MALTVNGFEIAAVEIEREMERLRKEYEAYVRREGGEPSEAQLREWAEEDVIEEALFREAAVKGQPVPSDERVRKELEENAGLYGEIPEAQRVARARAALQQRRMMREIRKGVKPPSEGDVRAYYDANPGLFAMPESVRLSHICRYVDAGTRTEAFLELLRVRGELEKGNVLWVEAVEAYSDSFQRDMGMFATVSRDELPPDVSEKIFALKPGEISDVIDFGKETLHLFRVLVRNEPETVGFDKVKDELKGVLFEQACQDALNATFDALKAEAVIQRL